jgi:hypothetical protein
VAARESGHVRVVGDGDQGRARTLGDLVEQRHDARPGVHVERTGRLVGEDQSRPANESPRDRDPLLLTAG